MEERCICRSFVFPSGMRKLLWIHMCVDRKDTRRWDRDVPMGEYFSGRVPYPGQQDEIMAHQDDYIPDDIAAVVHEG